MRVIIVTDLDEFGPAFATIDIIWDLPPRSLMEMLPKPPDALYGIILQPQVFVDMQDPLDPGGVKPWPFDY